MTEQERLVSTDPEPPLDFLRSKASDRKLRLFAAACVRCYWSHLTDERSRKAVEEAERKAEGLVSEETLRQAERDAKATQLFKRGRPCEQAAAAGAVAVVKSEAFEAARLACGWGRNVMLALAMEKESSNFGEVMVTADAEWEAKAVDLLIDLFNDPLNPIALKTNWLTPEVVALAQAIYDDRAFDRLPALAAALEAAGCTDAAILEHCRGPRPHVRGCWVVDLLLGKS